MKVRLEANQFEVMTASNGEEGLRAAQAQKPDLILVDIKMPVMDGYTFVRKLKQYEWAKSLPVIVLTGYENMKELFSVERITDYILKPFDEEGLLQKIKQYTSISSEAQ